MKSSLVHNYFEDNMKSPSKPRKRHPNDYTEELGKTARAMYLHWKTEETIRCFNESKRQNPGSSGGTGSFYSSRAYVRFGDKGKQHQIGKQYVNVV